MIVTLLIFSIAIVAGVGFSLHVRQPDSNTVIRRAASHELTAEQLDRLTGAAREIAAAMGITAEAAIEACRRLLVFGARLGDLERERT